MSAARRSASYWWYVGAVRGVVLGLLYPLVLGAVVAVVALARGPGEAITFGGMIAFFGALLGGFLGLVPGLLVGVVCSALQLVAPASASRNCVGVAGIVVGGAAVTVWMASTGSAASEWAVLAGGPAALGLVSLVTHPLGGPLSARAVVTTS